MRAAVDEDLIGGQPVDNMQAGGYFARWGEDAQVGSSSLGEHAGQQLGTHRVMGGGD